MSVFSRFQSTLKLDSLPQGLGIKVVSIAVLVTVTALAFHHGDVRESSMEVGDVWRQETLVAPEDFALYKSEDSLRAERERVRFTTAPIFDLAADARMHMEEHFEVLSLQLEEVFGAYRDYLIQARQDSLVVGDSLEDVPLSQAAIADSLHYMELRQKGRVKLSEAQWRWLGWDYADHMPDTSQSETTEPPLYERILGSVFGWSIRMQTEGVLNIPLDSIYAQEIIVRDSSSSTFARRQKSNVIGLNRVYDTVQGYLEMEYVDEPMLTSVPSQFVQAVFVPSLEYQRAATLQRWNEAERKISEVRGMVSEGEEIVRDGERITPLIKQKLISLDRARRHTVVEDLSSWRTLGKCVLAFLTFGLFFLYLMLARPVIFGDNKMVVLLSILCAGTVGLFALAVRLDPDYMYAVPVVIGSVILTVVFDSRVALFCTLTLAMVGGLILDLDMKYAYATMVAGTFAVYSVRGLRNRGQLFLSAAFALTGYALALVAVWLFEDSSMLQLGQHLVMAGISSFLLVTAYPFLWALERTFGITTDLRLLELSDTNQPLLRELMQRAPGTFNHSLQVANLAESVASAIGANALLTRVGALYHDVGKTDQPEYFIENQRGDKNVHDDLDMRESARIIIRHVQKGAELGQRYKLPKEVLDFVMMHHGTTRTEYFYQKAVRAAGTDGPAPEERDFRYPGPSPQTKETGILMLIDGVEAASRSMKKVNEASLTTLINRIFQQRMEDGQLDDTDLTFGELTRIKEAITTQLRSMYHVRVKYPGQEADEPDTESSS